MTRISRTAPAFAGAASLGVSAPAIVSVPRARSLSFPPPYLDMDTGIRPAGSVLLPVPFPVVASGGSLAVPDARAYAYTPGRDPVDNSLDDNNAPILARFTPSQAIKMDKNAAAYRRL